MRGEREVVETILILKSMARRIGCEFIPDERKLEALGFDSVELDRIYAAVAESEHHSRMLMGKLSG